MKKKNNKYPGPEGLHPRMLKEAMSNVLEPLEIIFKLSLKKRNISDDWRIANVTALFKKGNRADQCNYRPVSLTCVLCKTMKTIVREQLITHLKNNNLFSEKQFGFVKRRSTVLQLRKVMDKWRKAIDKGGAVDVAYCDFRKAFDTVTHKRLLGKLKNYNITGGELYWIEKILQKWKQAVVVEGERLGWHVVSSGVP